MATLTIFRKSMSGFPMLPLWIKIDEKYVALMKGKQLNITIPSGQYHVGVFIIALLWKWQLELGNTKTIIINENQDLRIEVCTKTEWWDIVFAIDLILWICLIFVTLPNHWDSIYSFVSNGFFILWLIHFWKNRNNFFLLKES